MAHKTLGQILFEQELPDDVKIEGAVTKGKLRKAMTGIAKDRPDEYSRIVQGVKRFGDEVATYEGISVGLDDIAPDYARRDPILAKALDEMKAAKTDAQKRKILRRTEKEVQKITESHPSDMTLMARSGGRGSINQLMKTVGSPVAAQAAGQIAPWLVTKSYAQGLKPSEVWVTANESRRNAILSTGSVVEPGAVAKVIVANMEDLVITTRDCGSTQGLRKKVVDPYILDRVLVEGIGGFDRGEVITDDMKAQLSKQRKEFVVVRSPMTCNVNDGVCQHCMGHDARGRFFEVGTNVGVRSAQAMTEPLTQFALNAKHGVRLAGGESKKLTGLTGFRVLTEVPKSFTEKAILAKVEGRVTRIEKAPQGGTFIYVGSTKHYTAPGLDPIVKVGTTVDRGDALSEGTPMPNELVEAKGIGEGRRYMADALGDLYARQGVHIDRRHTELLARKAMNYVRIDEDPTNSFLEGDVVRFDQVRQSFGEHFKSMALADSKDEHLAKPVLHYTEGTRITNGVIRELRASNVADVSVTTKAPSYTPIMKSVIQTPLLNDDWLSRLSHRYLKKTLVEGAGIGAVSDTASTAPVAAYVANSSRFGLGQDGKYASMLPKGLVNGAKRVLFGKGSVAGSMARPKVISDSGLLGGGIDNAAIDARRLKGYFKDYASDFDQVGLFNQAGELAPNAENKMRAIESALPGMRRGAGKTSLTPEDVTRLQSAGVNPALLDDNVYAAVNARRGGRVKRVARGIKNFATGDSPVEVLRQRYERGGLLGRGGIVTGDLALDPDFKRNAGKLINREYKGPREAASLAWSAGKSGLMDGVNKHLSYGMPAAAVAGAITAPAGEGESKLENVARPVGDALGWAIGGPTGLVGGSLIAGQVTSKLVDAARRISPPTVKQKPMQSAQTPPPVLDDVYRNTRQSMTGHPVFGYYNTADQARQRAVAYTATKNTPETYSVPRKKS